MARVFVFEGVNGSGKSSVIKSLSGKLERDFFGIKCIDLFSPGCGIYDIRDMIRNQKNNFNILTYLFLISADMNEMISNSIQPYIEKNNYVFLLDRYIDSTYVYQGDLGGIDYKIIDNIVKLYDKVKIDHTFILDIPYEISEYRRNGLKEIDKYEKEFKTTFSILRDGYKKRSIGDNRSFIDAVPGINEISDKCYTIIKKIIN